MLYILAFLRFLPLNFVTYNAAQIGSAVESILLAFALADRVNLLKREKEEKQLQYTRELQEQVAERTGELTSAVEKLKTASITDPLTGLSNRRHVDAVIQPWIAELQRARIRNVPDIPKRYLALCLADLDHFKLINDELGHSVGDKVLQAAADTLTQNVRATAILARWGGEEFLILDHVIGPDEDLLMAERLRCSILDERQPIFLEIGRSVSLSLGVVRYPFSRSLSRVAELGPLPGTGRSRAVSRQESRTQSLAMLPPERSRFARRNPRERHRRSPPRCCGCTPTRPLRWA